jgi:unsaturated rhamnogalacturonyl hydrolase
VLISLDAQQPSPSVRAANTVIDRWPEGRFAQANQPPIWSYELGALLQGMDAVWFNTADARYYNYIQSSVDQLVGPDGSIPSLQPDESELDDMQLGRQLLLLYGVTRDPRYAKAAQLLYNQLVHQPRTGSGGFRQKQGNPNRTRLDGLYMAEPFFAEYAAMFHHPEAFSDINHQFALIGEPPREAMGPAMMALVDTIPYYREDDPERKPLIAELKRDAAAVARSQDANTGLWYRGMHKPGAKGHDLESSSMFVYALAKGVRLGYLPRSYLANAARGYNGQKTAPGDPGGVGAFLLASTEMENAQNAKLGRGKTVVVDAWFNSQKRADAFGQQDYFHYKWNDQSNDGYSLLGRIFRYFGADTETLYEAPTISGLAPAQVYIIASPDTPAKNPNLRHIQPEDATQIAEWVKRGGVLMIFANDPANTDLDRFNLIAEPFGIHFNSVLRKHVVGDSYEMGKIVVPGGGAIFHDPHTLFMKDVCNIAVTPTAAVAFQDDEGILMATAKYGKGTVFATVDPWLYNEYTDGRKLPAGFDNFAAGKELVRWILAQVPRQARPAAFKTSKAPAE